MVILREHHQLLERGSPFLEIVTMDLLLSERSVGAGRYGDRKSLLHLTVCVGFNVGHVLRSSLEYSSFEWDNQHH
jgi:hypothetical protein